jgi:hypothetical protein
MANQERAVKAIDKQLEALRMRMAGKSYFDIAEALGYAGWSGAHKAVSAGLKKTLQEPADEVRRLEIERLDNLLESIWQYRMKPDYLDRILKIMERRAKLLGLDAPTKQDVTSNGEMLKIVVQYADSQSNNPEAA